MCLPFVLNSSLFHIKNFVTHVRLTNIETKCQQKKKRIRAAENIRKAFIFSQNYLVFLKPESFSDEIFVPKISCDIFLYIYCILIVTTNLDNVYRENKCK